MASELRLARELTQLLESSKTRTFTFGDLLSRLGVQGQVIFLILLVTPMLQPIPLPGVSTILSVMAVIIGFQILFHLPPWLPKKYEKREIDSKTLEKWLIVGLKTIKKVENYCRPRRRWSGQLPVVRQLITVLILISALLLALPLPIPFSNFFPSITIFTFGLGLLEDDGLLHTIGFLLFLISAVYIGMIFFVPWYLAH